MNVIELAQREALSKKNELGAKYRTLLLTDRANSATARDLVEVGKLLGRTPADWEQDKILASTIRGFEAQLGDAETLQDVRQAAHRALVGKEAWAVEQRRKLDEKLRREIEPLEKAHSRAVGADNASRTAAQVLEPLRLRWRSILEGKDVGQLQAERPTRRTRPEASPLTCRYRPAPPVETQRDAAEGFTSTRPKREERPTASGYEIPAQPVAAP